MPRALITLTTDFGSSDHFTGVMKGVIRRIAPGADVIDITHEIPPFEIAEGAFVVSQTYRYFPRKTIHVVVVDPGVGTARRPILVEAAGQYFLGPDNGVLSMVYGREKSKVRLVSNAKLFLEPVSQTFHGRDIFAPVAAQLAKGLAPARVGKLIGDYLRTSFERPVQTSKRTWTGAVLKVDRFGNLITNLHADELPQIRVRPIDVAIGATRIYTLARTYAEGGFGEPVAIIGSSGYLEICVNQDSAARRLGCSTGAPVEITIL
ncbi:MAG: SAM-dependent chlorinase/fluorinase [Acidobacteria bacterium]|nr:SAM-dependent chlorinase/fluorinase [Acidobacteriota bacterium]